MLVMGAPATKESRSLTCSGREGVKSPMAVVPMLTVPMQTVPMQMVQMLMSFELQFEPQTKVVDSPS